MSLPNLCFETEAARGGAQAIAGIDEAGRGPLAGPVVAAAVILDRRAIPAGLDDSKKLRPSQRTALFPMLVAQADVGVAQASVAEIDRLNILRATHLAMRRAIAHLRTPPDYLLIDGNRLPAGLPAPARAIVGGDARALSIAAASVVAKVVRDRLMCALAQRFPGYGWQTNAGYPTKAHKIALRRLGVSPFHRRSFAPIHNILYQQQNITD
ncbi:MAG: ribonuclease HII [Rhodobacteraceae bacterium]|nr:ribonuclease HII [Paracoccaceae bacterium]